ncbi:hypothetical protein PR003_g248 [Phytophthora rubi]|uniref:U6 snRNA-associated Sm-like protein LSm4 n=1 Tax=Phytophthora rubi TaxID=129364 RepID=A0A6A4FZ21_9STRA|nr:hypothetical protein PR001_g7053 [Phytophthora rubi]KAE9360405.1 hypothetical protein PR003_g248 [Phytophthora rubi]
MLPLSLLKTAQGHPMLVELKNGDTYNGHLVNCDTWMNVNLREVICTSKDGDRFWKMPECYIRGNTIKYIRVPNEILDMVNEEDFSKRGGYLLRRCRGIIRSFHVGYAYSYLCVCDEQQTARQTVDAVAELVAASVAEGVVAEAGVDAVDVAMALAAVVDVVMEAADVAEVEVAVVAAGAAARTS